MKRNCLVLSAILCLFFISQIPANSSTVGVSVAGLDSLAPDTIWSYQIEFAISGQTAGISVVFDTTNQHQWEVVPNVKITNWNLNSNITADPKLVILADEKDFGANAPLVNGPLFSIIYPDNTLLSLIFDSFILSSDLITVVDMLPSNTSFGAGSNQLVFTPASAVPIPAAAWLLGSGLVGLVALKRRKKA